MEKLTFSRKQIFIHWLSAILIVMIVWLPYAKIFWANILGDASKVFLLHKSLGVFVLVITLFRLFFIIKEGVPKLIPQDQKLMRIGAKAVQGFLYLLLLTMPLSGLIFNTRPLDLFGLQMLIIPPFGLSEAVRESAKSFHLIAQYALFLLVLGHSIMALFHHHILKDRTLKSMLGRR